MDTLGADEKSSIPLAIFSCQNGASANQYFSLSKTDQLRREDACALSTGSNLETMDVVLSGCEYSDKGQKWLHEKVKEENNSLCLFSFY